MPAAAGQTVQWTSQKEHLSYGQSAHQGDRDACQIIIAIGPRFRDDGIRWEWFEESDLVVGKVAGAGEAAVKIYQYNESVIADE